MSVFSRITFAVLWLFVFSIPSEKAVAVSDFGTLTKLIGFLVTGLALLTVAIECRIRKPGPFHITLAIFMLWSALTLRWTIGLDWTASRLNTYAQLFVMVLLLWQFASTQKRVHSLMAAYVAGTLVPFLDTLRTFLSGGSTQYYQRYSATGAEPNDLAVTLALSVPISYYLWLHYRHASPCNAMRVVQWFFPLQILMVCANVLLSASRGGTLAAALSLTVVLWTSFAIGPKLRFALLGLACVGALVIAMLVPATSWKRLSTLSSEVSDGSLNGRTRIWTEGWNAFNKNAMIGVGAGAFPDATLDFFSHPRTEQRFTPVAHNTFLSVLVETGIIGMALFLIMLAQLLKTAIAMPRLQKRIWLTALAVWALGVSSLSWEDRKPMWLIFALLAAHGAAIWKERCGRIEYLKGRPVVTESLRWEEAVS